MNEAWPKLSETLPQREVGHCRRCDSTARLTYWVECDEQDRPTPAFVVLCQSCANTITGPHPRLYREETNITPLPGVMAICGDCSQRQGARCQSPEAKFNGGPGLEYEPKGNLVHLKCSRKSQSGWRYLASGPVTECSGKLPTFASLKGIGKQYADPDGAVAAVRKIRDAQP